MTDRISGFLSVPEEISNVNLVVEVGPICLFVQNASKRHPATCDTWCYLLCLLEDCLVNFGVL